MVGPLGDLPGRPTWLGPCRPPKDRDRLILAPNPRPIIPIAGRPAASPTAGWWTFATRNDETGRGRTFTLTQRLRHYRGVNTQNS